MSFEVVATAMSQLRNAYISSATNRNDPFNAITFLYIMLALIPERQRPTFEDMSNKEPSMKDFLEDPEEHQYAREAWAYFRELAEKTEGAIAKYLADLQTQRSIG